MTVPGQIVKHPLLWFLAGCALFLYLILFTPWGATIFLRGDASFYMYNAQRMLHGQVMYNDFFQFTSPGTELVYLVLFSLFGPRLWISNFILVVLGLSLAWLSVVISRSVMEGPAVFIPGLCFLTCCFFNERDPTHHWFSILAVMGAVTVCLQKRTSGRMGAVGMLCGVAAFFTQLRGLMALAGFMTFLVWEHRRRGENRSFLRKQFAHLIPAFLITAVAEHAYFIWKAGLRSFFNCTVVFGLRYWQADSYANSWRAYLVSPPPVRPWYGLPWLLAYYLIHVLIPGIYLVFLARYRRSAGTHPNYPWDRLMLVGIVGLFEFLSVAKSPSFYRLCIVTLPGLILFAWLLTVPGRVERALAYLVWAFVAVLIVLEPVRVQRRAEVCLRLPAGTAAFQRGDLYELFNWLSERTHPSDLFFQAAWADVYIPLGLQNPTPVPYVTNTDYTRPEQVQQVLRALDTLCVPLVLWGPDVDSPRQVPYSHDHLVPLRAYLRNHYHVVKTFADDEQIWERSTEPAGASTRACESVVRRLGR